MCIRDRRYSISAVSVCATSPTIIPVDENGEALTNAIMWMDNRAVKETELVNATHHPILDYCGGEDSVEWTIPKMLWIKNNQPEIYQKSYKIIEQLDYINPVSYTHLFSRERDTPSTAGT